MSSYSVYLFFYVRIASFTLYSNELLIDLHIDAYLPVALMSTQDAVLCRACELPKSLSLREVSFGPVSRLTTSWSGQSWGRW